jgi:FAD binding domain of DNA photolyase
VRAVLRESGLKKVDTNGNTGVGRYIGELAWRDFYTDILCSFPRVCMGRPYLEKFSEVVWENHQAPEDNALGRPGGDYPDGEALRRWKDGMTGVPIVDAAMRCIRKIGWSHNRLRMIVAMFLTKHLMIDWRVGERVSLCGLSAVPHTEGRISVFYGNADRRGFGLQQWWLAVECFNRSRSLPVLPDLQSILTEFEGKLRAVLGYHSR